MSLITAENSAFVSLLCTTFQVLFTVYYNNLLQFPYANQFIEASKSESDNCLAAALFVYKKCEVQ